MRAVLRRVDGESASSQVLHVGELTLDVVKHSAMRGNQSIELTPTEFDLVATLTQNPGRAFTGMQLLDRVQGETCEGYERTVDAHIKNLRQKIGDDPQAPKHILNVFGVGYKLAEDAG